MALSKSNPIVFSIEYSHESCEEGTSKHDRIVTIGKQCDLSIAVEIVSLIEVDGNVLQGDLKFEVVDCEYELVLKVQLFTSLTFRSAHSPMFIIKALTFHAANLAIESLCDFIIELFRHADIGVSNFKTDRN